MSQVKLALKFGQQTPRRWGWGTPLKKRTATRTGSVYVREQGFVNPLLGRALGQQQAERRGGRCPENLKPKAEDLRHLATKDSKAPNKPRVRRYHAGRR